MATVKARIELDRAVVLSVAMGQTSPFVFQTTRQVKNRAEVLAPVDTGNLRGGISMTMRVTQTTCTGRIENRVKYDEMVQRGTVPHTIRAKRAKALAFNWAKVGGARTLVPKKPSGRTGFRKGKRGLVFWIAKGYVNHPGTKPRPYMLRALAQVAIPAGFKVTKFFTGSVQV